MICYDGFVKWLQQQQKTQDVEMTSSSYATRHLKIWIKSCLNQAKTNIEGIAPTQNFAISKKSSTFIQFSRYSSNVLINPIMCLIK